MAPLKAKLLVLASISLLAAAQGFHPAIADLQRPIASLEKDPLRVPGENPLYFCADPQDYLFDVYHVDLDPKRPKAGQNVTVEVSGDLHTVIDEGSELLLEVGMKFMGGVIPLLDMRKDLCEQLEEPDRKCPISKGPIKITKTVDIPGSVPNAALEVKASLLNKDEDEITCVTATIFL